MCSPLSVVQNDKGKQRLAVDFWYINQFLPIQKFKYEGLNLVPQLFQKGNFFLYICVILSLATIMLTFIRIVDLTLGSHGVWVSIGGIMCLKSFRLALHPPAT